MAFWPPLSQLWLSGAHNSSSSHNGNSKINMPTNLNIYIKLIDYITIMGVLFSHWKYFIMSYFLSFSSESLQFSQVKLSPTTKLYSLLVSQKETVVTISVWPIQSHVQLHIWLISRVTFKYNDHFPVLHSHLLHSLPY